jgi:hypothetical protein
LALYAEGDKDVRVYIERGRNKFNHLCTEIVYNLALVGLFLLGHELVYSAYKRVYNSALKFYVAFKCV